MKPLGRKYYHGTHGKRIWGGSSKIDYHFNKKWWINWWEDVCTPNKRLEQRRIKKEIEEQLKNKDY